MGSLGLDFFGSLLSGGDIGAGILGDMPGGAEGVFGRKPEIAPYVSTDLGTEAKKAVAANTSNLPEIQALLSKILPGYSEMVGQGSKNTLAMLRGEIPQDVQDQIRRTSAFRSLSGGFGGSGMAKSLTARDLGLTSLDLMDKGSNSAQRWAGLTEGAVSPFSITAKEQADQQMKNNLYSQAVKQFEFNVAAAPSPAAAGLFNLDNAIGSQFLSFGLGSAMGAMGGGGGSGRTFAPSGNYNTGTGFGTGLASVGSSAGSGWNPYSGWGG
jgi:hypothetical protein